MEKFVKDTSVSIAMRDGKVVFGKYNKEGRNGYHSIELEDGTKIDRKVDKIKFIGESDVNFNNTLIQLGSEKLPSLTPPKTFSINQKFMFLENMVRMVIKKTTVSMVITGEGGLGKTFTVKQELAKKGLTEGLEYTIIKGFSTARGLFRTLYENSEKLIVFDDCDEILKNDVAKNLLKGALDSYDERRISWVTSQELPDLPTSFLFEGQIIFISNLSQHKIDQALLSRSMSIDLSMKTDVKIERMRAIIDKIKPSVPIHLKEECLELISEHKEQCADLNMRTLIKTIDIRVDPENEEIWKDMATYCMISTVS